jgi:predicted metal-binding protein
MAPVVPTKTKVLIIGCKNLMIGTCVACSRCIEALNKKKGQFAGVGDSELVGLLDCGGCPGNGMNARLNEFALWNAPDDCLPDQIFVGSCITAMNDENPQKYICPYANNILGVIKKKVDLTTSMNPAITLTVKHGTHDKRDKPIKTK